MKLNGSIFQTPMMHNLIDVKNNTVTIHNFENENGIISSYATEIDENACCVLSKKDYQTLYKLDDFDMAVKDQKVIIKTKNGTITFANIVDITVPVVDMEQKIELDVITSEFLLGEKFAGESDIKIQQSGLNITSEGYYMYDDHQAFIRKKDTKLSGDAICIPKESFKHIVGCDYCVTDRKIIAFVNQTTGRLYYTALLSKASEIHTFDNEPICTVSFKKEETIKILKLMQSYAKDVQIKYDKKIHMICKAEINNFDMKIEPKFTKGSKLNVSADISQLLKILELSQDEDVQLNFHKKMISYEKNDIRALSAYRAQTEQMEVE